VAGRGPFVGHVPRGRARARPESGQRSIRTSGRSRAQFLRGFRRAGRGRATDRRLRRVGDTRSPRRLSRRRTPWYAERLSRRSRARRSQARRRWRSLGGAPGSAASGAAVSTARSGASSGLGRRRRPLLASTDTPNPLMILVLAPRGAGPLVAAGLTPYRRSAPRPRRRRG
jgi:hypothetical protein